MLRRNRRAIRNWEMSNISPIYTQVRCRSSAIRYLTRAMVPSSVALVSIPVLVESVTSVQPLENDLTQVLTVSYDGTYSCRASEIVRWISVGVLLRRRWNLMMHRISLHVKELLAASTSIPYKLKRL